MMISPRVKSFLRAVGLTGLNLAVAVTVHYAWPSSGPAATAAVKPVVPAAPTEEERIIRLISKASPAVVSILVQKEAPAVTQVMIQDGQVQRTDTAPQLEDVGRGTGFMVSADGMILTNRHVGSDRHAKYTAFLSDGRSFDARILDIDPVNDLALLKIDAAGLPTVDLETNDNTRIGQTVIAIGNALGKYDNTVTRGILSGVDRSLDATDELDGTSEHLEDVLQTDAAINAGNSGGPLLDLDGKVIGVNTAIDNSGQGIGFAIPVSEVRKVLSSYARFSSIARPRLGLRYVMITPDLVVSDKLTQKKGALVEPTQDGLPGVVAGGPAGQAGVHEGDVILSINGITIDGKRTLTKIIQDLSVGDRVKLHIARGDQFLDLTATLDAFAPIGE